MSRLFGVVTRAGQAAARTLLILDSVTQAVLATLTSDGATGNWSWTATTADPCYVVGVPLNGDAPVIVGPFSPVPASSSALVAVGAGSSAAYVPPIDGSGNALGDGSSAAYVPPTETYTFQPIEIVFGGSGGSSGAAPTASLAANHAAITLGDSVTLTWDTANATAIGAVGQWSGTLAASGTQTLTPTIVGTYLYGLVATGDGGSAFADVVVTVNPVAVTDDFVVASQAYQNSEPVARTVVLLDATTGAFVAAGASDASGNYSIGTPTAAPVIAVGIPASGFLPAAAGPITPVAAP